MVAEVPLRVGVGGVALQAASVLHHLDAALAQVLHCHADTTGNLGTEQHVHYTEVDLHPAPPSCSYCPGSALSRKYNWESGDRTVCIIQRSTCILHHLYTALAQDLHCHADTTGNLGTKQYAHYTEVDLYLHHLYTALAQVLHCHADMTSNLGTEPCVRYTEADLHPAPPLYWQFGDLNVCTLEAGLETGQVCVCVWGGGGGTRACMPDATAMFTVRQSESVGTDV